MEGLTSQQAEEQLRKFGSNEITEKKPGVLRKFGKWLLSPIALMLLAAAILSLLAKNTFDFYFILVLMFLNFFISFWQEHKADQAISKLQEKLSVQVKTMRDGKWAMIPAQHLVPNDLIQLSVGDVVPADAKITQADNLTANEAALTGESLPKEKGLSDSLISGSFLTTGKATAEVTSTGKHTSFGKTLQLAIGAKKRSLLEQDILRISKFLSALSILAVIILTFILWYAHTPFLEILLLDLSLVIAGIPISLPTVMSLIIGFGVVELARQDAIVRQLSALENMANVDMLLSDKTGTLTQNKILVEKILSYDPGFSENAILQLAAVVACEEKDPIDQAISQSFATLGVPAEYKQVRITPADSQRKRSTAIITGPDNQQLCVTVGATQVVSDLCAIPAELSQRLEQDISRYASQGYRALAVALNDKSSEEKDMRLLGMLLLSDTVFADAAGAVAFLNQNGIEVKMLTGDSTSISQRVGRQLGLRENSGLFVVDKKTLDTVALESVTADWWRSTSIFAEILPEDKLRLTQSAKRFFRVAVTGDGVNDLPAIKAADVGIAVSGAVDALKSAADIVLLSPGISVIKNAVLEARKIFARLYCYSVYRLSESLRLIITIAVLGIIYKAYPLTPVQLILLAFLNDLPIISLAFNRVHLANRPASIDVTGRFLLSSLFGLTGVANSLLMFFLAKNVFHLSLPIIETLFFLKLTIGGHMLIYVAHTEEVWYKYLPSRPVILATTLTQMLAIIIAASGIFMTKAPLVWILIVVIWAFFWMQVSELVKQILAKMRTGSR